MSSFLEISRLGKVYDTPRGPSVIVENFDLQIRKGEFITLIGHSGCGKSTVLSMIAGLTEVSSGGAILSGGHVSVVGTFFGVVIIAIITQALVLFAIDPFVVQIVLGALILWAVGINRLREMRVARAKA